jgi:hypothetical protein
MPEPSPGKLLHTLSSRFELRGQIGSGSMGVVYRAFDHELGREVALKTLRANDPELFYSLKEEFRTAASIVHPNLVDLHELFVDGSECFFTMELLDAAPFDRSVWQRPISAVRGTSESREQQTPAARPPARWIASLPWRIDAGAAPAAPRSEQPSPAALLASAAAQLVEGVAALHDAGRLHGDLKPSNILLTREGRLVVLDFGLSSPLLERLVGQGFSGTLAYAAPEQLWGGELTTATDWYSVGVVLYEALTGELPERDDRLQAGLDRAWAALDGESKSHLPAQFVSLLTGLLRLEPVARPTRDVIVAVLGRARRPRDTSHVHERHFVGRELELAALRNALAATRAGWLTAVDVHGASGMGKTELIRQFALQAMQGDALVVRGQCRLDESVSYQALDQVIDDLSKHLALLPQAERSAFLPEDFASLVRVFPVLGRLGRSERLCSDADGTLVRQRAVLALRQMLWRLCAWQPLIVWVDDANWGDAESQRLLCDLLQDPAPPLLLIFSHRESGAPWLRPVADALAAAGGQWLEIEAGPLDEDSSCELVASLLGPLARQRPGLARRVTAESERVPLFIAQLCRLLAETTRAGDASEGPLTLVQVVDRRVSALAEEEQRVAEMVALIESPLPVEVVAAAAGLSTDRNLIVSRLVAAQLLRLTGARPDPRLTSYHQHVRETILARLDPASRKRGHGSLARALERLDPSIVPEILLHHWLGAGDGERAREVALRAARAAADKLAFVHAAALYRTALGLLDGGPEHSQQYCDVQAELASALSAGGRAVEAGEQFLALSNRAPSQRSVRWMQRAAENFLVGGQLDQGMSVLTEALKRVHLPLPSSTASAVVQSLGRVVLFRLAARRPAPTGPSRFDTAETLRADLCLSAAKGLSMVNPMLSAYFAFLALDVAARTGDACRMASALCLSGMMLAAIGGRLGRWGEEWLDEATHIAEASGDVLLRGRVLVCRAQVDVNRGLWSSVLQQCDAAMTWLTQHPDATTWERNMADMAALRALEEHGELTLAWKRAAEWRADAQKRGDLYAEITADLYLAFAQIAEDAPDRAESRARLALARWSASPTPFHEFYRLRVAAYAELYRERPHAALEILQRAERALSDARLDKFPAFVLDVSLLCARIHLRLAQRGQAGAKSTANCLRALDRLEGLGRPDASGYAALSRAGMDAVRGNSASARVQLGVARAKFTERQMLLALVYVAAAESTLGGVPGDAASRASELSLRRQGIVKPQAWLALHAPGFARAPPVDPSGGPAPPASDRPWFPWRPRHGRRASRG